MFVNLFFLDASHIYWHLKIILFFFIGGFILFNLFLHKYYSSTQVSTILILFLLMMGLSPYLSTLILYYSLLLVPHHSDGFYLFLVFLTYLIIYVYIYINISIRNVWKIFVETINKKIYQVVIIILLFMFFSYGWTYYISIKPITEHDTLEYAIQGKVFHEQKIIRYDSHRYDKNSGFYYVGLHGFSFPLLATLERMTNHFLNSKDYFFRSINSMYGILILLVFFLYSYEKTDLKYALIMSISLLFTYGFFETIMKYHIDNFRLFFLISSVYILVQFFDCIKEKGHLHLLGVFLGAQSNAHSLCFMLACILLFSLFLFLPFVLRDRIKIVSYLFLIMLIYGGFHYILDIFFGTGWIFKEIKFY